VSPIYKKGYVDFVIKEYPVSEEFPKGGVMSRYIGSRRVGDSIQVEAPMGNLKYHGFGEFEKARKKFTKKKIVLICAGTGITPHLQIANSALRANDGV
jgi:nitrate reductase (NAD(P)H)